MPTSGAATLHSSLRCCAIQQKSSLPSSSTTSSSNLFTTRTKSTPLQQPSSPPTKILSTTTPLPSKSKSKSILEEHPLYTQTHTNLSLQFKEKILCLEILGIDSGKALALNPDLHSASLDTIQAIICYLQLKGIHQNDLPRIFGMCPQILTSNIETELAPVFQFLSNEMGINELGFRRVINKCPRLLICSVRDQLKPSLFYLQRLGFSDMRSLAYNDPILLVSSVENTLIPKLEFMAGLGFSKEEVIGMVLRCPILFTFSIENNFKPKLDYFVKEMNGRMEDLKNFPQFFSFSLEKRIKPRHLEAMAIGMEFDLPMLKTTDDEFRQLLTRPVSKTL